MAEANGFPREQIGTHAPDDWGELRNTDVSIPTGWTRVSGLSSTISDILDELGYRLSVPATDLPARSPGCSVVGRAVTIRYLPSRYAMSHSEDGLIHKSAMKCATSGDVLVIEGDGTGRYSVFGGLAAHNAKTVGIAGLIVDGAVRDIDQIGGTGIPVWAKGITAVTGRRRLHGAGVNVPVRIHDIQVLPGDIVAADDSGICFVPTELLPVVDKRLRELIAEEQQIMQK